jgi:hypothetical protein
MCGDDQLAVEPLHAVDALGVLGRIEPKPTCERTGSIGPHRRSHAHSTIALTPDPA